MWQEKHSLCSLTAFPLFVSQVMNKKKEKNTTNKKSYKQTFGSVIKHISSQSNPNHGQTNRNPNWHELRNMGSAKSMLSIYVQTNSLDMKNQVSRTDGCCGTSLAFAQHRETKKMCSTPSHHQAEARKAWVKPPAAEGLLSLFSFLEAWQQECLFIFFSLLLCVTLSQSQNTNRQQSPVLTLEICNDKVLQHDSDTEVQGCHQLCSVSMNPPVTTCQNELSL